MSAPLRSGRPAIGTVVHVPGVGECVVAGNDDPAVVTVRTSSGAVVRVGERALAESKEGE